MRFLKKVLVGIAVVIAVPLIVALFIKQEYLVERDITINKPKPEVFEYIRYLKNQNEFSKWAKMDPMMKVNYTGTDGTVGFVSAWESDSSEVGKGEQEIKKITAGERIDYELRFIEPFPGVAPAYMITEAVSENQTRVVWGFNGKMTYPTNFMLLFMDMDQMIGTDLATGLSNLKTILESKNSSGN